MKKIFFYLLFISLSIFFGCGSKAGQAKKLKGKITISGAFALYPLTEKWAEEFRKLYPEISFEFSAKGAGKGMSDVLSGRADIAMVSGETTKEELSKRAFVMTVSKDAVVAVINDNNPIAQELLNMGIPKELFEGIFIKGSVKSWGGIYSKIKNNNKINVITRSDTCGAAEVWAKYLGQKQNALIGAKAKGDPGLIDAIKKDPFAIGYINMCYAYDNYTKRETPGLKVIPIDINKNGMLDDSENFYFHKDSLLKAIAQGRYPSPPAHDLYYVTKGKPSGLVLEFIRWVLTEGQKFVPEAGYVKLHEKNTEEMLKKLE